jgi:hypothetical protein
MAITVSREPVWNREPIGTKGHIMGQFRKSTAAVSVLLLAGLVIAAPAAAATFDGEWNVQIASSNTACSGGTSVSIGINNGQVASTSAMVTASGRVVEAGIISVTLASGMKRAVGYGRLSGASGSGTWRAARVPGPRSGSNRALR